MSSSVFTGALPPAPVCPARLLASLTDSCFAATLFSNNGCNAETWGLLSLIFAVFSTVFSIQCSVFSRPLRLHATRNTESVLRFTFPPKAFGVQVSQQTRHRRNRLLAHRKHFAQFGLGLFKFGLLVLAGLDELRDCRLELRVRSLAINRLLQSLSLGAGFPAEPAAGTAPSTLIARTVIVAAGRAAASAESSSYPVADDRSLSVHHFFDQRLERFPIRVILDLQALLETLHHPLPELRRVEVASA